MATNSVDTASGTLNKAQLERLWMDAGGPASSANTASAIALAESSGVIDQAGDPGYGGYGSNFDSIKGTGYTSFGLWQIHTPAHPQYNPQQLTSNALYNATAAVAISNGGTDFSPWSTYNSGAYLQYLNSSATPAPNSQLGAGITRPGGQPAGSNPNSQGGQGETVQEILGNYVALRDMPRTAPPSNKNPFQWWLASFTGNWDNLGGGVQ